MLMLDMGILGCSATIRACGEWSRALHFFQCMAGWRWVKWPSAGCAEAPS